MTQLNCSRRKQNNKNTSSRDRGLARALIDSRISQLNSWSNGRGSEKLFDWSDRLITEGEQQNIAC